MMFTHYCMSPVFLLLLQHLDSLYMIMHVYNLHSYSFNRDPVFFKNSHFLVDRLHWGDLTGIKHSLLPLIGHPDGLNKLMIIIVVFIPP